MPRGDSFGYPCNPLPRWLTFDPTNDPNSTISVRSMRLMKTSWERIALRAIRLSVGISIAPIGILMAVLFCTTGRPVPRSFVPDTEPELAKYLVARSETQGVRRAIWFQSHDGNCNICLSAAEVTPSHELTPSEEATVFVFDRFASKRLGWFPCSYNALGNFSVTPDKQRLLAIEHGKLHIRRLLWADGAVEEFSDEIKIENPIFHWRFYFAPDGRRALICSVPFPQIIDYDLLDQKRIAEYAFSERKLLTIFPFCFLDSNGRPKLCCDDQVWDPITDKMNVELEPHGQNGVNSERYHFYFYVGNTPCLATLLKESRVLVTRSLDDLHFRTFS
jgi:hypothetical protein